MPDNALVRDKLLFSPLYSSWMIGCTDTCKSHHTQSTAYLIGEFAAEKIIEQYHLG
jgi:hypothetical protein